MIIAGILNDQCQSMFLIPLGHRQVHKPPEFVATFPGAIVAKFDYVYVEENLTFIMELVSTKI